MTENYKVYCHMLNWVISNSEKSYDMNIFTNLKNDTGNIWNAINQLKNNYKKIYLSYIYLNDKILRHPSEISHAFNIYYTKLLLTLITRHHQPLLTQLYFSEVTTLYFCLSFLLFQVMLHQL